MPFNADTRCGLSKVEFNMSFILEWVEDITDCEYYEGDEKDLWLYVYELENYYSNTNDLFQTNFNEWFCNEYNNVEAWDLIAKNLKCKEKGISYYEKMNS
jgi:hypothetical protein